VLPERHRVHWQEVRRTLRRLRRVRFAVLLRPERQWSARDV
jgi:hypothetical protein